MASLCLVAGDPSGDVHAAHLVEALRALQPSLQFVGLGGESMRRAGVDVIDDLTHAAAIGPFDAAKHFGRFVQAKRKFRELIATRRPDGVVLIDFGDFNLPVLAPLAKAAGCRVIYYISPQIWAWGRFRVRWAQRYVDRMLVLFPFEEIFYRDAGVPVTWVGHPLIDRAQASMSTEQARTSLGVNPARMIVGLLPGSRAREVARHLPILLAAAEHIAWTMPGVQFVVPKAPQLPAEAFRELRTHPKLELVLAEQRIYDALQVMDAAIVASGTATLEAALFQVPMAVVYRTSTATYLAARAVMRVPHIAMVNVLAGRQIVPEFVQSRATPVAVGDTIVRLLREPQRRDDMRHALREVTQRLGPPGAIDRAAKAVLHELVQETGRQTTERAGAA